MGKTNIDLYTFLARNSADYADILRTSCEALKSGCHNLVYKCIRSVGNPQMPEPERIPDGWEHVADVDVDNASNSHCHAIGVHKAIELLQESNTKDIIFIDADTVILYQDWDKVIFNQLNKYDIFGWAKEHDFPSVFFFAFQRFIINKITLDFFPVVTKNGETPIRKKIVTEKECEEFGIPVGDSLKCDTGWKIPQLAHRASLKFKGMERIYGKDKRRQLAMPEPYEKIYKRNPEHMAEYHWSGDIFGLHKQACRNHAIDSDHGKAWKARINEYLNRMYGWTI